MKNILCAVLIVLCIGQIARAAEASPAATNDGTMLLTIFLRHDQTKTLAEINEHLNKTGFWKEFPPEGVQVESWHIMMGIGQVVTLRLPPDKLRAVNRVLEQRAWGAFCTEFYPTNDFKKVWENEYKKK